MKIKLLAAFLLVALFVSCSGDEADPVTPVIAEKNIKFININYLSGGDIGTRRFVFENNRIAAFEFYGQTGNKFFHTNYTYSADGLLILEESYNDLNNTFYSSVSFEYDDFGRIKKTVQSLAATTEPSQYINEFIYSSDSAIIKQTRDKEGGKVLWETKYMLNNNGQVYKIVRDTGSASFFNEEVVYSGNNVVMLTKDGIVSQFTYDMANEPKGHYLKMYQNQFGTYKPNSILHEGHFLFEGMYNFKRVTTDNFIVKEEGGTLYSYEYEFDSDGFPIRNFAFEDGVALFDMYIEYE